MPKLVLPGTIDREVGKTDFLRPPARNNAPSDSPNTEYPQTADETYFEATEIDEANLVTSRVKGTDYHAPAIDIDVPMTLILDPKTDKVRPHFWVELSMESMFALDDAYEKSGVSDMDFPMTIVPSSTPNHYHLYMDKLLTYDEYDSLLRGMTTAGIVEQGYYGVFTTRKFTALRLPWIHKTEEERAAQEARRAAGNTYSS